MSSKENILCEDSIQQNAIFMEFSRMSEIEHYLHGNVEDTLYFIKNEFTSKIRSIPFLERTVIVITSSEAVKNSIGKYFQFLDVSENFDTVQVIMEYQFEGLIVYAKFKEKDCELELLSYETAEQ
jgi:hypothetical protein